MIKEKSSGYHTCLYLIYSYKVTLTHSVCAYRPPLLCVCMSMSVFKTQCKRQKTCLFLTWWRVLGWTVPCLEGFFIGNCGVDRRIAIWVSVPKDIIKEGD